MIEPDHTDVLLDDLGRFERARMAPADPEWEAVVAGHRDADEVAAARLERGDPPAEIERRRPLYTPLDDDEVVALMRSVHERIVGESGPPARARRPLRTALGVVLAIAAAAILWIWSRPTAGLPDYALEFGGGLAPIRGRSANDLPRYRPDTPFELTLRPRTATAQPVELAMFAYEGGVAEQGTRLELHERTRVNDAGIIHVSGPFSALGLDPGQWTIVACIASPSRLETSPSRVWAAKDSVEQRVLRFELFALDPSEPLER